MNPPFNGDENSFTDTPKTDYKNLFSIREMEQLSGIKAHTLRIWEHRYKMFSPARSLGKVRNYGLDDVQRLLSAALLLKNDYKISALSALSLMELKQKLQTVVTEDVRQCQAINHLIYYMYADIERFEDVLDGCVQCWGIDRTLEKVILPFMEKVGLFSYNDKNHETHFVVTAVRRKIIYGIEKATSAIASNKTALLFLPEGEHYDLLLLHLSYVLKQNGMRVLYLGTDISIKNLQRVMEIKSIHFLFTYIPLKQRFKLQNFALYLKQSFPALFLNAIICEDLYQKEKTDNVNFIHYKFVNAFVTSQIKTDN